MARKESKSNEWSASERVGQVTLFQTARSSKWQMFWVEEPPVGSDGNARKKSRFRTTGETDISLARIVAHKMNQELFKRRHFPEVEPAGQQAALKPLIAEFVAYLKELGRTYDHTDKIRSRLGYLARWMKGCRLRCIEDVTPDLLREFTRHLREDKALKASTVNHYLDSIHNFFGFVIFKKRLMRGPNPAACGRQAHLERLPDRRLPPPTIHPDQVNAIIDRALHHGDPQIVNLLVFVCEGGFRFQELQFLQVGDIDLASRTITIDAKKPDLKRVRPELRRRCMTREGLWLPKSRAGRRPIHITDRLARVIGNMGLGEASDWVFVNAAGNQVAGNKTLERLKRYALEAGVLVDKHPMTGQPCSVIRWHWLRHYHRTRAHVSKIRREVSKIAMGHAGDTVHDHYRGLDPFAFHEEYEKFDSGIDDARLGTR
jgi:integrase